MRTELRGDTSVLQSYITLKILSPSHFTHKFSYIQAFYMIYMLTKIGLTPGGSSTVHIYTQTVHRTTQLTAVQYTFTHKQYTEQHN
jgi:hypothetical protein